MKPTNVLIDRQTLEILMDVANAAQMELDDGIVDGTYADDALAGHPNDAITVAIANAYATLSEEI